MSFAAFVLGATGWSASEYLIHRFVGHRRRAARSSSDSAPDKPRGLAAVVARITPRGLADEFNAEHLAHHADPTYFAPSSRKLAAAVVVMPVLTMALAPFVGMRRAASFTLGFGAAYGAYELLHRGIHTRGPKGPYARWMRRHHLAHHHTSPRSNYGVTSPIWDRLTQTNKPLAKVRVPRHMAPPWLVDAATGEAKLGYERDYELVGRGSDGSVARG
jgi:hypothetical protein